MDRNLQTIHLHPLPSLEPLEPPGGVFRLFSQQIQNVSLGLSAVPQEQLEDDDNLSYRALYEQKCEQEVSLKNRIKCHEQAIKILEEKNASLESQVARLQEQRWKKFDYSRLSARGRSKSHKKIPPTIEVKLPGKMSQNKQILIEQDKFIKTDRDNYNEDVSYYKQEVREYKQENKQLRQEIQQLKRIIKERANDRVQSVGASINQSKNKLKQSPQKTDWNNHNASTPIVSPFSPFPKESSETVKKQPNSYDQLVNEIKKLKNELLYKDLLIDKIRTENARQNDFIKKHLVLSVSESQKVAEQTTSILNSFKTEIIRLSQQLLQYKRLPTSESSRRQSDSDQRLCTENELMCLLKTRRSEKIPY